MWWRGGERVSGFPGRGQSTPELVKDPTGPLHCEPNGQAQSGLDLFSCRQQAVLPVRGSTLDSGRSEDTRPQ